jgi:hypothetical protein
MRNIVYLIIIGPGTITKYSLAPLASGFLTNANSSRVSIWAQSVMNSPPRLFVLGTRSFKEQSSKNNSRELVEISAY